MRINTRNYSTETIINTDRKKSVVNKPTNRDTETNNEERTLLRVIETTILVAIKNNG